MTRNSILPALLLSAVAAMPAAAAPGRVAITAQQVAFAMSSVGMQVSPDQVQLLSDVVASTASPMLKVQSMEQWGTHRMKVRMNCARPEQCLPFVVAVSWDAVQTRSSFVPETTPLNQGPALKIGAADYVVRSGAPATLLLDGPRIHIRLSVICLENGAPGQVIRVSSPDRKQLYTAQVVDGSILRGSL
jgi:hypothetical protein